MSQGAAYLDYQASTPLDPRVKVAMDVAYAAVGNPSSEQHAFGWAAAAKIELAREQVAHAIGADKDEITFTSGATEANNIAVLGAAIAAPSRRRRVIVSGIEHKSVLEAAKAAERFGLSADVILPTPSGLIDPASLAQLMADDVAVVSILAVSNEIGTIQPVQELCAIAQRNGAFFHVDATQALAALQVDVAGWGVDALSLSGHKIYGPKGIGALYVANHAPWRPQPLMFGGGQQDGLRPGTLPTELCVGLGEACRLIWDLRSERDSVAALRDELEEGLRDIVPGLSVTCQGAPRHPGSLHVRLPGIDASDLLMRLQPRVAASTGSACTSGLIDVSYVLTAVGLQAQEASECIRFSLGRFSSRADLEVALAAIQQASVRAAA